MPSLAVKNSIADIDGVDVALHVVGLAEIFAAYGGSKKFELVMEQGASGEMTMEACPVIRITVLIDDASLCEPLPERQATINGVDVPPDADEETIDTLLDEAKGR